MFYFGAGIKSEHDPGTSFLSAYKESRLSRLFADAQNPQQRQSALAKMIGLDRDVAMQAQRHFQDQDTQARRRFQEDARMAHALSRGSDPNAGQRAWEGLRQNPHGANLPERMDPGILSALSGGDDQPAGLREFQALTQGLPADQVMQARLAKLGIRDKPETPKYALREVNGGLYYVPEQPMGGFQPQNTPAANDAFDQHVKPLLQREGGWVDDDAGAGPTNFGINSRANPDVDVRNLTPEGATQLYRERYWNPMGGDSLPAGLQGAVLDAAVNMGVGKARELLAASGGDPERFDQLRLQHYEGLARQNPQKYGQYLPGWRKRVAATRAMGGMTERYEGQSTGMLPAGAIPVPGLPLGTKRKDAPSGYQWNAEGTALEPIRGGPADRKNNPTDSDHMKAEMALRKEVQDRIKQDRSILNMHQNVVNATKNGTAAGDLSMIFAYMKMLDPGSVVREQEFANAQNAAGVPDRIRNLYNYLAKGNRLNPTQRKEFEAEARLIAAAAQDRISRVAREYQSIAEAYGYDTTRATGMPDFRNVQPRPQEAATDIDALVNKYRGK